MLSLALNSKEHATQTEISGCPGLSYQSRIQTTTPSFTLLLLHIAQWRSLQDSLKSTFNQPNRDKAQKWNTGTCIQMLLFSEFVSFNLLFTELCILENFLLLKYGLKLWNHTFLALKVFALLWLVCVVSSCPQSVSITLCEANRSFGCLKDYGLRPWICTVLRHCMT